MLLGTDHRLDQRILLLLSQHGTLTARRIKEVLDAEGLRYSFPGIYKELHKLEGQGVVVKSGTTFRVNLSWVLQVVSLADDLYDRFLEDPYDPTLLPEDGSTRRWTFRSLARVDDFWIHTLLLLGKLAPSKRVYQWLPHPWFHLLQTEKGGQLQAALKIGGIRVQSIIGGTTELDRESERLTTKGLYEFSYAPGPFARQLSTSLSVTEDYLLSIDLDAETADAVQSVYDTYKTRKSIPGAVLLNLGRRKIRAVVKLSHRDPKIAGIVRKFRTYFGR